MSYSKARERSRAFWLLGHPSAVELAEAHFFVLSVADEYMPGPEICDLVYGVHTEAGYKDKRVTVFEALSPEDAQHATIELLDAGCLEVSVVEYVDDEEVRRDLSPERARAWLEAPLAWNASAEERRPQSTELHLTPQGKLEFDRAVGIYGARRDERYAEANRLVEEFQRQEPQFWAHLRWFEDWTKWIDGGFEGPKPEHPEWPRRPETR